MRKIVKAKKEDLPSLLKCLRRVSVDNACLGYKDLSDLSFWQSHIEEEVEAGRVYVSKENKRVLGAIEVSFSIEEALFPKTHSSSKTYDLLDKLNYRGEPTMAILFIFVDPSFQRKQVGKEMVKDMENRYAQATWAAAVSVDNQRLLAFFKKMGFTNYGIYPELELEEDKVLIAKPYVENGLCRNLFW